MKKPFGVGALGCLLTLAVSAAIARGDLIVRKDGSVVEGKIVSRDSKGLGVQVEGQKPVVTTQIPADTVVRVVVIDEKGAAQMEASGTATPAKRPAPRFDIPREPAAPPVAPAPAGSSYYVIPLHGVVGETFTTDALEKSLADAVKRKPTVVVLDIDSPGGLVSEAETLMKTLHKYNKQLRIVALAGQNLSASAITSLSVKEIYVKSSSVTGAATAYNPVNMDLPPDIREKMQSAWRAVARNSAEEGGHEPLLAEAMIDSSKTLHLETVNGKKVVKEGPGDNIICQKGKILTLTSHEAVECGLAVEIADDFAELGDAMKLKGWKECPGLGQALGQYLPKRWESFEKQEKELDALILENMVIVRTMMPSDDPVVQVITTPVGPSMGGRGRGGIGPGVYGPGSPLGGRGAMVPPGLGGPVSQSIITSRSISAEAKSKWKDRSLATVVALQKLEQNAADEMALAKAFGENGIADEIKDTLPIFAARRADVYANRNKYLNDAPPAPPVARGPAVAPTPAKVNTPTNVTPPKASTPPAPNAPAAPATPTGYTLSGDLAATIKQAVDKKSYQISGVIGGSVSRDTFTNVSPDGVLVGLRCGIGKGEDTDAIIFLQPLFLTPKGIVPGEVQGNSKGAKVTEFLAREGYVVGGAALAGTRDLKALRLKFTRMTNGKLDLTDTYDSATVGIADKLVQVTWKTLPIGITGKGGMTSNLGLGFVNLP